MMQLGPSGHVDTFTRDNLPPADLWPEIDTSCVPGLLGVPAWRKACAP